MSIVMPPLLHSAALKPDVTIKDIDKATPTRTTATKTGVYANAEPMGFEG